MSTRKIYTNLDLRFNELLNAKLAALTNESPVGTIGIGGNGKIALVTTDGISEYVDGSALALAIMGLETQIGDAVAAAAAALDRQNHTGTQVAATISDFVDAAKAAAQELTLDQLAAAAADVDFGGNAITGVVMPEGEAAAGTDAANRAYVDAAVSAGTSSGADKLTTARDFSIAGDVTAEAVSFDGTGNVVLQAVIADGSLAIAKTDGLQAALDAKVDASQIGVAGGVAPLGGDGLIAAEYLPGFVDDVLEFADFAALPAAGEKEKIYVTLDNGNIYRWSGTAYVRINDAVSRSEEALKLTEAQEFSIAGVITAEAVEFDGTGPVTLNATIADGALSVAKTAGLQDALDAKFAAAGGVLQGTASYAAGVAPVAAQDLVHKDYVDTAVAAGVAGATMIGSDTIEVNAEKEISVIVDPAGYLTSSAAGLAVDVAAISQSNKHSFTIMADGSGVINHQEDMDEWMVGRGMEDMPYAANVLVFSLAGQKVEVSITWDGTTLILGGQGADADEEFNVVVRA